MIRTTVVCRIHKRQNLPLSRNSPTLFAVIDSHHTSFLTLLTQQSIMSRRLIWLVCSVVLRVQPLPDNFADSSHPCVCVLFRLCWSLCTDWNTVLPLVCQWLQLYLLVLGFFCRCFGVSILSLPTRDWTQKGNNQKVQRKARI